MKSRILILIISLLIITACTSDGPKDNAPESTERAAPTQNVPTEAAPLAEEAEAAPTVEAEPTATEAPAELAVPGLLEITLLTAESGVGSHPLFEWQHIDGAARYALLLFGSDGRGYWAWEGSESAVYLGGLPEAPAADSSGPALLESMQWYILAFDVNDQLIASSPIKQITP